MGERSSGAMLESEPLNPIDQYMEWFRQRGPNALDDIPSSDRAAFARKLYQEGFGGVVEDNLDMFSNLDNEIALRLIEGGRMDDVVKMIEHFQNLSAEVAQKIAESYTWQAGIFFRDNLRYFNQLSRSELLEIAEIVSSAKTKYVVIGKPVKITEFNKDFYMNKMRQINSDNVDNLKNMSGWEQQCVDYNEQGILKEAVNNPDRYFPAQFLLRPAAGPREVGNDLLRPSETVPQKSHSEEDDGEDNLISLNQK